MIRAGPFSSAQEATPEVQEICNQVKRELQTLQEAHFPKFVALQYRTQAVNGTNYLIKVYVGHKQCLHIRLLQDVEGGVHLTSYRIGKTKDEPLDPF
ncbi:leukocyte cysteine proteinase inhibitor 1-like [Discoglossus pictus]